VTYGLFRIGNSCDCLHLNSFGAFSFCMEVYEIVKSITCLHCAKRCSGQRLAWALPNIEIGKVDVVSNSCNVIMALYFTG
jgi:hypothetical protein